LFIPLRNRKVAQRLLQSDCLRQKAP